MMTLRKISSSIFPLQTQKIRQWKNGKPVQIFIEKGEGILSLSQDNEETFKFKLLYKNVYL